MTDEIVYICNRCGEGFSLEEGETRHYEEGDITVCPNCGSDDIEEAVRCRMCHEIIPEYTLKGGVCKDCFNDAVSAFKACIGTLTWEREVLEDHYGNIDITEE